MKYSPVKWVILVKVVARCQFGKSLPEPMMNYDQWDPYEPNLSRPQKLSLHITAD